MSSGLSLVNQQRKSCPSRLWSMSVGRPGNGRQPLDEPYTVQWMRWPISCGDQPPTGEPDAGEPPVRFGGRGDSNQSSLPLSKSRAMPCTTKSGPMQNSNGKYTVPYASNIRSGSSRTATVLPVVPTRGDSPNCLPYLLRAEHARPKP